MKKKYLAFVFAVAIFVIAKILWWSLFVSLFLSASLVIIYYLGQSKNSILYNLVWWGILFIDAILLILLIVPTKAYDVNPKTFYAQKENYMKIYVKDPPEKAKYMQIIIWRSMPQKKIIIKLSNYEKWKKIILHEKDKIYFVWRKENKSYAAIYLWDGTILRITPWTKLRLEKVTKNLKNLTDSETKIKLKNWNVWFHVIKLIKDSSNMQIETSTWQMLIIRWTAWLVSRDIKNTYAVDYSHFIEVKNKDKSAILKQWQWAIITEDKIHIVDNFKKVLEKIWLNENVLKTFEKLDKKHFQEYQKQLIEFIKKQLGNDFILKVQAVKLKLFSIWDETYKKYLNNLETYQYLVGNTNKITERLLNDPNLAFIAWNLQKQNAKVEYLYNTLKENMNVDVYKTYIINLWIQWKIKEISNEVIEKIIKSKDFLHDFSSETLQQLKNNKFLEGF